MLHAWLILTNHGGLTFVSLPTWSVEVQIQLQISISLGTRKPAQPDL